MNCISVHMTSPPKFHVHHFFHIPLFIVPGFARERIFVNNFNPFDSAPLPLHADMATNKFITEKEAEEVRKRKQEMWEKVRKPDQPLGKASSLL